MEGTLERAWMRDGIRTGTWSSTGTHEKWTSRERPGMET
jgi:hypothetical protein